MEGNDVCLSVVIPAYNEERNITTTIAVLGEYLRQSCEPHEIIVADDGSTDRTPELVAAASLAEPVQLLRSEKNQGKGHAVRRGMLAARGEYVFFMDADLSYPVENITTMLQDLRRNGCDVVIGSRALPESHIDVRPPLRRYVAGRVYSFLVRLLLMKGIPDTQCGLKGFSREAAHDLFSRLTLNRFAFDVELLFLAHKKGYRLKMVPVRLRFVRETSKVRLVSDSLRMFLDLVRIRLNDIRGVYGDAPRGPAAVA